MGVVADATGVAGCLGGEDDSKGTEEAASLAASAVSVEAVAAVLLAARCRRAIKRFSRSSSSRSACEDRDTAADGVAVAPGRGGSVSLALATTAEELVVDPFAEVCSTAFDATVGVVVA